MTILTVAVLAATVLSAQPPKYRARLAIVPIDIAMQATIAGLGSATATLTGSTLTVTGSFSGLKSPATSLHVHRGPRTAMRGPVIGELTVTRGVAGTISGAIELRKDQIDDLAAGRLYLQLQSEKAPEGNLWGWLLAAERK